MLRGKAPQSGREGPRRRKVILLGFMGSGKSKVGRLVATHRGAAFVDTDEIIAEYAGKSIPDIFEQDGEEAFRGLETEAIRTALDGPAEVIALGGGAATRDENWRLIEDAGALTIYLKASPEVILARVGSAQDRPLLAGLDAHARLRKIADMLAAREPHYLRAALVIESDNTRSKHDMAAMVAELVNAQDAHTGSAE